MNPLSGPASAYRHPDYLDEAKYANLAPEDARLDLCDISDEQALIDVAAAIRPLLEAWAADPGTILPYPVADHHWRATLARPVLDAFAGRAVGEDRIFFGDGTYELWKELCGFVLRKGTMLGAGPVYPELAGYFTAAGGRFRAIHDDEGGFPAAAVLDALARDRDVVAVYADLPYNATGGWPDRQRVLEVVAEAARRDVLVILDEAYANFLGPSFSYVPDVAAQENLVVLRSLSKAYNLRGLRFAFAAAGARVAPVLGQVRSPYAPSQPAAQAALLVLRTAPDLVRTLGDTVARTKARVVDRARAAGLSARPTHPRAPNLMLRAPGGDLGARLASLGVRVTGGAQFAFTAPQLSSDVRMRVPLRADRVAALLDALAKLGPAMDG
jgi:histidinol-phosphate/aromatic aminotransferase/cobyric acid decarboxylase-like protein